MPNETPLKGALIGCGDIVKAHLPIFNEFGIEIAALCDIDEDLARKRRDEYGTPETKIFTDYKDILAIEDLDFVSIATPVRFHAPITIAALEAGKHVACEKPSTLSVKENKQIIEAADKADKKVIFFSSRMRGGYTELAKTYVDAGDLGDIYRAEVKYFRRRGRPGLDCVTHAKWFLDKEQAGGGVIMDMGQYFMDRILNLVGWPRIESACATTFRGHDHNLPEGTKFDVEEHCTILARAENGMSLSFDFAWVIHQPSIANISILGTEGGIAMGKDDPFVFYHSKGGPWNWMNTTTEWQPPKGGGGPVYDKFFRAIRGEAVDIGTTPEQALIITELTEMALRSAEEKREIRREELQ
ncbi:MAG: Gfo/Idh/MocA family protein [Candidatus Sumerlaeota bacterium]